MIRNKKGFTLVELLAVIVILAIILVIAVPQIIKTIDSAREGALVSSAKLIATSAEKEYLVRKTLGDTSFEGLDTIPCTDVVKENTRDYGKCIIKFDGNGKATVQLEGKGKFKNKYVCAGTITNASVSESECVWEEESSSGNSTTIDAQAIVAMASDEEKAAINGLISANGVRYAGASPKNYVWFECADTYDGKTYGNEEYKYEEACELWRIIGVFDGRIKIVRDEVLPTNMHWDTSKWDGSEIEVYLNDGDTSFYSTLSNETKMQIGNKSIWYTGVVAEGLTPAQAYSYERTDNTGIENYVGLIYPSDYGYGGTNCTGEVTFDSETCGSTNNWLKPSTREYWMISQSTGKARPTHSGYNGWLVYSSGDAGNAAAESSAYGVRPSVYLSANVEIIDGDGSSTKTTDGTGPYIIKKMSV